MGIGFTDTDEMHAVNKKTMLESANEKILVADHSKFDQIAFAQIGSLKDITMIVTDEKPEDKWLQAFAEMGVKCVYHS